MPVSRWRLHVSPLWIALMAPVGLEPNVASASAETPSAFVPQIRAVTCAAELCGSMEISWYRKFQDGDASPRLERNGANVRGRFRATRPQTRDFHYLQTLTRFKADDFRWSRDPDAALPARFVDVPPFGVWRLEMDASGRFRNVEHKFDALPWFDEGEFPLFEDRPRAFLASARAHGKVTMEFETWLVCVIHAREGPDRERVSDDSYAVAALIGWTWGYDIAYRDIGAPGADTFEDYTFTLLPLRFVTRPSPTFEESLGATMGSAVTDRFDIRLGHAAECSASSR